MSCRAWSLHPVFGAALRAHNVRTRLRHSSKHHNVTTMPSLVDGLDILPGSAMGQPWSLPDQSLQRHKKSSND